MTVPELDSGDYIEDEWVDAVAEQLNGIQYGTLTGVTSANGLITSMNFPTAFGGTPAVVATVQTSATTQQDTAQITAVNASAVQFRLMRNGNNAGTGQAFTIHWVAMGAPA